MEIEIDGIALSKVLEKLWISWVSRFSLRSSPDVPVLKLTNQPRKTTTAMIRMDKDSPPTIYINEGFLLDIRNCLEKNKDSIIRSCLINIETDHTEDIVSEAVKKSIIEIVYIFILLHESFHLFGGHFNASMSTRNQKSFYFDESAFGIVASKITPEGVEKPINWAYFLEIEADNSSLQWLMQTPLQEYTKQLAFIIGGKSESESLGIFDCNGPTRLVLFRALVSAIWFALRMIEEGRYGSFNVGTHPLSGARMLSALATIMEQYAEIDAEVDEEGRRNRIIGSDEEAGVLKSFINEVIAYVLKADWSTQMLLSPEKDDVTAVYVAIELSNMLFQKPPSTEAGEQLIEMERIRRLVTEWLEPHRYYQV